jgi:integrase
MTPPLIITTVDIDRDIQDRPAPPHPARTTRTHTQPGQHPPATPNRPQHIAQFLHAQLDSGRGPVTLRRCIATLSSALNDAVRQRRLTHNAAKYTAIPRPAKPQRVCWTPSEAVTFLHYCANINDPLAELFEVLVGTGMRKGEALALHWNDVYLDDRVLFVRHTQSNVNNTTPVVTTPKTKTSLDWIGLSSRVVDALQRQARRQHAQRLAAVMPRNPYGLVFCHDNGQPLQPEYVLHRFHKLIPRIRVPSASRRDTRDRQRYVPLGIVSKSVNPLVTAIGTTGFEPATPSAVIPAVASLGFRA